MKGTDTTFLGFFLITAQELPHSLQEWSEVAYIIKDKSSNQFKETGKRIAKQTQSNQKEENDKSRNHWNWKGENEMEKN